MNRLIVIILSILCLGACVPGHNDFSDVKELDPWGWRYADVLTFNPVHQDSIAVVDIALLIRHNSTYPYSNLWLEIEYSRSDESVIRDSVNLVIADKYGRWKGRGNATDLQLLDTVARSIRHKSGSPIRVRHIMRVDTLTGVDMVGIELNEITNR